MMIVTKFLRSCCGQATVDGNSLRAGRPLPASMAAGVGTRRTISLYDTGGIEPRVHQSPAGCASRSFRIFPSARLLPGTRRGRARSTVDPQGITFNQGSALKRGGLPNPAPAILFGGGVRFSLPPRDLCDCVHRASILMCKERDDCSHNDPYSGEPCSCLCPPKRILLQFFGSFSGRLVLFPEPTLYVAAQHFAVAKSRHNRPSAKDRHTVAFRGHYRRPGALVREPDQA